MRPKERLPKFCNKVFLLFISFNLRLKGTFIDVLNVVMLSVIMLNVMATFLKMKTPPLTFSMLRCLQEVLGIR